MLAFLGLEWRPRQENYAAARKSGFSAPFSATTWGAVYQLRAPDISGCSGRDGLLVKPGYLFQFGKTVSSG